MNRFGAVRNTQALPLISGCATEVVDSIGGAEQYWAGPAEFAGPGRNCPECSAPSRTPLEERD